MIRWLHISDLHHGQAGHGGRWPQLRQSALADLREEVKRRGKPDILFFTGDLAFSGGDDEYDAVEATLDEIREAVQCDPLVLPVPGNHDLKRPGSRWPLTRLGLEGYVALQRQVLDRNEEIHTAFERIFGGYTNWWRKKVEPQWRKRGIRYQAGLFPGDFRLAVKIDDIDLAVVGMNSALRHHDSAKNPDLVVEIEQCGFEFERWIDKHEAAFLLMHHPRSFIDRDFQPILTNNIYPKDRFVACLFGHMHKAATDTGGRRRWLQAGSLFGLEHYGSDRQSRVSGYSWGELARIDSTRATLSQWARRFTETDGFVAETEASIENGLEVALRPPPPLGHRARLALVADDSAFRRDLASELDTFSDVADVLEIDPSTASLGDLAGVPHVVVLLTSTTVPSIVLQSSMQPSSLVLQTPFRSDGDSDVLREAQLVRSKNPHAQLCADARQAAAAVRSWLTISRRQILAAAVPAPAPPDGSGSSPTQSSTWVELDAASQVAKAHFDEGHFGEAADAYRTMAADLTARDATEPERNERLAKARLNLAACALSVDQAAEAERELLLIDVRALTPSTYVRLATLWVNAGNLEKARATVPLLEAADVRLVEQIIALREGKLPEDLDPSLRLEACEVLLAQGRIAEAAETAMKELNGTAD